MTLLPETPVDAAGAPELLAVSPGDAYALVIGGTEHAYLAHSKGDAWESEKLPFDTAILAADLSADGTLWLATKDALWRRSSGKEFTKIKVAALEFIVRIAALTDKDIWLVGKRPGDRFALVHNGGSGPTVSLPTSVEVDKIQEPNKRAPATAACENVYVHIRTLGATGAKPPKAFPDIKGALEGSSLSDLFLRHRGRRCEHLSRCPGEIPRGRQTAGPPAGQARWEGARSDLLPPAQGAGQGQHRELTM